MRRGRWAITLWLAAIAPTSACNGNEGRNVMPSYNAKPSPFRELSIPDVELFVETQDAPPRRPRGAAKIGGGATMHGKAAFDAIRPKVGSDANALATLAMLFIDEHVAGHKPWTQPHSGPPAEQQAIAKPPALSGDTLVYWRMHEQLADLVRCTVQLTSGSVTCELGSDVVERERIAGNPRDAAKQDLASQDPSVRVRGIRALGAVNDDAARTQLIDLALNAHDPGERATAVEVLGKIGGTGVVDAVSRVLLFDRFVPVREAAATALGQLGDPAAREALEKASTGDADPRVQVLSEEALKKLRK